MGSREGGGGGRGGGGRVPVQLVHVMLDGVKGAGVSIVTVVSSHASDISGERREGGAYKGLCVCVLMIVRDNTKSMGNR